MLKLSRPTRLFLDLGCDHGQLAIAAAATLAPHAIGVDIHAPPLVRAAQNLLRSGLKERVDFFQGDTLVELGTHLPCVVALAGVGGALIADRIDIIRQNAPRLQRLLVNPMVDEREMRRALYAAGMAPVAQQLVREPRRIFLVEAWDPATTQRTFTREDIVLGEVLKHGGGNHWKPWLQTQLDWLEPRSRGTGATDETSEHLRIVQEAFRSAEG
jgi:tRNA A22 N-methylase